MSAYSTKTGEIFAKGNLRMSTANHIASNSRVIIF